MSNQDCWVDFWENDNKAGDHRRFNGPIEVPNLSNEYWSDKHNFAKELDDVISSLATGLDSWLTVFSKTAYKGDSKEYGPNSYQPKLKNDGLENTIASFKLYDKNPHLTDIYSGNAAKTNFPSDLGNIWSTINHKAQSSPGIKSVLGTNTDEHSVFTEAFSDSDYQLWSISCYADQSCQIINQRTRLALEGSAETNQVYMAFSDVNEPWQRWYFDYGGTGFFTVRHRATNLLLFGSEIAHTTGVSLVNSYSSNSEWSYTPNGITCDYVALGELYPEGWNKTDSEGHPCAEFTSQDSQYRAKQPIWNASSDGGGAAIMKMDHINSIKGDDHATLTIEFSPSGEVISTSIDWDLSGFNEIPTWVIDLASKEIGFAASVIATLLSEGAAIELDRTIYKGVSKIVTIICDTYNCVIERLGTINDGGQANFIAVVNHNFNKLCSSMKVTPLLADPDNTISFDLEEFSSRMGKKWDGNSMEYVMPDDITDVKYRTWKPDTSIYSYKTGIYVSTKIDHIYGGQMHDDHIILMLGFTSNGTLILAQAAAQFAGNSADDSYLTEVFTSADGADPASQLVSFIRENLTMYYGYDHVRDTTKDSLPDAIKLNIDNIALSIKWNVVKE